MARNTRTAQTEGPDMSAKVPHRMESVEPGTKHEQVIMANNRILGVINNLESLLDRIAPVPTTGPDVDPHQDLMSLAEFLNTEPQRMDDRINRCNQLIENIHQELFNI